MSNIYCIRHSQASANAEDYDQLSELGYEQGSHLKNLFSQHIPHIDHVWIGPRKRHRQTYETSALAMWPQAVQKDWLDEFPAHDIMEYGLPTLVGTPLAKHIEIIKKQVGTGGPEFLEVLQYLCDCWITEELILPNIETGKSFKNRIAQGIDEMKAITDRGESIIIFSSAGSISSLFGAALDADPKKSLRIAWALYNASITSMRGFQGDLMISSLNWIDHIPPSKRTFV